MRRYLQVFLLAVAFDLYWALVVLFREQGLIIWLALAIYAFDGWRRARRMAAG